MDKSVKLKIFGIVRWFLFLFSYFSQQFVASSSLLLHVSYHCTLSKTLYELGLPFPLRKSDLYVTFLTICTFLSVSIRLHNPTIAELRSLEVLKKYRGESYMSRDGIARTGKCMGPACKQCIYKCSAHISTEERLQLFNNYYDLASIQKQWQYIAHCTHRGSTKYQSPARRRRKLNYEYYFQVDHRRIRVCKTFLMRTLGISNTVIKTALRKCNEKGELIMGDRRGKFNKKPATRKVCVT